MKKPSFLERLTGSVNMDEYDDTLSETKYQHDTELEEDFYEEDSEWRDQHNIEAEPLEGELPIDMYQTGDNIVIRALIAGVDPDDLDVAITRDMVTIKGKREEYK